MANKFVNIVSKDRKLEGNDSSNIQLDILRLIWSEDVFERTISFLKSMSMLRVDEATIILMLPLILFAPDRRELHDRRKIFQIQTKYSFILKKYLLWKYGKVDCEKIYNKLLLKLIELRSLQDMHSSILLDADPDQLDPFPLALLLKEKEETLKTVANSANAANSANVINEALSGATRQSSEDTGSREDKQDANLRSNSTFDSALTPESAPNSIHPSVSSVSSHQSTSPYNNDLNMANENESISTISNNNYTEAHR